MELLILAVIVVAVVGVLFAVRKKLTGTFVAPEEESCGDACDCAAQPDEPAAPAAEPEADAETPAAPAPPADPAVEEEPAPAPQPEDDPATEPEAATQPEPKEPAE